MIVCCGEALIDFIPTIDGAHFKACPGGSILNISVGLGRMGVPVRFLSRLSTDIFGTQLKNYLVANNVDLSYCPQAEGQTTLAFVSLPETNNPEPQYAFYSEGAVDRNMLPADLPFPLSRDVSTLHFGSISLALEPGATTLETLMQRECRSRLITLDPNVRPIVIKDWAAYRQRFEVWLNWVHILRLSEVDLNYLYPGESISALLQGWFDKGVRLVILTTGAEGASAYLHNGAEVYEPAEKVIVRDTVGAGDTFFSAVLTFLYEQGYLSAQSRLAEISTDALSACLKFASKAAAINCTREGANPPYRSEME